MTSRDDESEKEKIRYLGGIIKRINNFDYNTAEGRQIFHKTVYLIQAFGFHLGYSFSWQNCGVYSTELTKVGYLLTDVIQDISVSKFVDPSLEQKFQKFLEFIEPIKNDIEMLRIVTGLHLMKKMNPDMENKVIEIFLADNTNIGLDKISEGWKLIDKVR